MNNTSFVSLVQNVSILLAMTVLFDLFFTKWRFKENRLLQIPIGFLLGLMGIILMLTPWVFMPGIIFDTRSILISLSGLFFGTIPTLILMLITSLFRLSQGGVGASMGVAVIVSTGCFGILIRHTMKTSLSNPSVIQLYFFGLVTHFLMLICAFFMPLETALNVLKNISIPVIVIYPIGSTLISLIIVERKKYIESNQKIEEERNQYRNLLQIYQNQIENINELIPFTLEKILEGTGSVLGTITFFDNHQKIQEIHMNLRNDQDELMDQHWKDLLNQNKVFEINGIFQIQAHLLMGNIHFPVNITAIPIIEQNETQAIIVLGNTERQLSDTEHLQISLLLDRTRKIFSQQQSERKLASIEWMLSKNLIDREDISNNDELTDLNKDGIILKTLGIDLLSDIVSDYIGLLDTSAAIYELNGDYALAIFSSSWCKFLDQKSRTLCQGNLEEALDCDQWYCHQSCWKDASKKCMEQNGPVDIECHGGLHIYSIPIQVSAKVVGAINFGYGNPPTDTNTLGLIAEKYKVEIEELRQLANSYRTRPPFIIELAKQRLKTSASLIGLLIERNQSQLELRNKEELLDRIIDILPVGLWFADQNGKLNRANPAGVQIWGAEPKIGIDEYGVFKARHYPSMKEIQTEDWALYQTINEKVTIENELLEIDTFDGKKKIILNYSTPILSKTDEIEGAVVVNLDVTDRIKAQEEARRAQLELERLLQDADQARQVLLSVIEDQKIAEEKIQQLNQELEQRVKDRTAQLEVANRELEAFAYSVSHDLRAPLRAMDGFSAALIEDFPDSVDSQARHYLERIQQASQRMGQLIEDLLHLSRVTRREINLEHIDMSILAKDVAKEFEMQYENRDIEFDIDHTMPVHADSHLLRIALENLISNAVKFSNKKRHAQIKIGMLQNNDEKIYYVRDNGVGFNMKYSDKLFNPFQRLHSMEEFPGTGIGLVTVQRIINRHGGRIWPDAKLNKGATFYFTLGG
jgi:PAS domain S-box-containing protein